MPIIWSLCIAKMYMKRLIMMVFLVFDVQSFGYVQGSLILELINLLMATLYRSKGHYCSRVYDVQYSRMHASMSNLTSCWCELLQIEACNKLLAFLTILLREN